MAAAAAQPSDTECPVCHEDFNTPKILPCAHLLCRQCLVTWLQTETDALCPLCRDVIADAKARDNKTHEAIADSLPTDLAMEARVECADILSKSHVCGGCGNTTATSICLNCGDMLCASCTSVHRNMSVSRHHEVEGLVSLSADRLASIRRPACPAHADRPTELYCPTHGAAICHLCATSKHRGCVEVMELEEKIKESRTVLSELSAILKAGESKLEVAISELDEYLLLIEKTTQAAVTDINQKCDRLVKSVEKCRDRLTRLITGANAKSKDAVRNRKTYFVGRRGKMTSHHHLVECTSQTLPRACVIDDTASSLQRRVSDLDVEVILPDDAEAITMAILMIDTEALERVERELLQLGQLGYVENDPFKGSTGRFHTHHGKNIVLSNDQQTAERVKGQNEGVVLSSEPLKMNMLYEVRLDEIVSDDDCGLCCGVMDQDPASLTLPPAVQSGWQPAVGITPWCVWDHSPWFQRSSDIGMKLYGLAVGSRVGLLVDAASCLHLFVDGQDQGVAARDVKQPCYAFFDLFNRYKKVTTLPLTRIPKEVSPFDWTGVSHWFG